MRYPTTYFTALLSSANDALAFPFSATSPNPATRPLLLPRSGGDPKSDTDYQEWITQWAAIGDSYSAGIGAGKRIDQACSRYDLSYPYLMENPDRMGPHGLSNLQFLSCSGYTSVQVLNEQIPKLQPDDDLVRHPFMHDNELNALLKR
jgi:hypothetical protein